MTTIFSFIPDSVIRAVRVALAQAATIGVQTAINGVLTANPAVQLIAAPLVSGLWKQMRDAGHKGWFWKIF